LKKTKNLGNRGEKGAKKFFPKKFFFSIKFPILILLSFLKGPNWDKSPTKKKLKKPGFKKKKTFFGFSWGAYWGKPGFFLDFG